MKQSIGVTPFKHIIKWMYPSATAAFDGCASLHDQAYKNVDWSLGSVATYDIDQMLYACMLVKAGNDVGLQRDALTFYKAARNWGVGRAWLWKLGVRY